MSANEGKRREEWPLHCEDCGKGIMRGTICLSCSMDRTLREMEQDRAKREQAHERE